MKSSSILVRWQVEGVHRWVGCNIDKVSYLKDYHRHVFYFEARISVDELDRELEFISIQHQLVRFANSMLEDPVDVSCEMLADATVDYLCKEYGSHRSYTVTVLEDNENGGIVSWNL
ncbi:MAG: hypothetical protein KKA68_21165 [Gammaproteobacteria bacterium]|nr:hypothetical protein [Gammaproteobacteria bacterium]